MTDPTTKHRSSIIRQFESFRDDIDEYHDRRERLIKASRDITNLSKKTIFLLHRCALEEPAGPNESAGHSSSTTTKNQLAARKGYDKLRQVQRIYANMQTELEGDKFWRYHRQVSPGLQEYIEALSFAHYLDHETLITFNEVQQTLADPQGNPYFPLPIEDYLLGLSDLTGELMRFAISGLTLRGGRTKATDICSFVRACRADFERFTSYIWELRKKQVVTTQSLEKIEDAAYTIVVRSSEYDLSPEMLDDIVARTISNFGGRLNHCDYNEDEEEY